MNVDLVAVYGMGVMTLATPCVLPLLPVWLGMLLGSSLEAVREQGGAARARLLAATASFAAGFALVFTLLGLGASAVGGFLQAHRDVLTMVGGAAIVLFGLKFLGVLRLPALERELRLPQLRTGRWLLDAALFGVVFALGWTPCVGPILGAVLTYTASRAADPLTGALYLATYSLGVASPLLVLALFADRLLPLLGRVRRRLPLIEKATGVALMVLGLSLIGAAAPGWAAGLHGGGAARGGQSASALDPPLGAPSPLPRLVEFYEPGCPACEQARPRIEGLRHDCAGRRIDILTLDAADGPNRDLARRYRVGVVPTVVLLDASGAERGRLIGVPALADLRAAAASLLDQRCAGVAAEAGRAAPPAAGRGCPGAVDAAADEPLLLFELPPEPVCEG